jgi:hypothetical protein
LKKHQATCFATRQSSSIRATRSFAVSTPGENGEVLPLAPVFPLMNGRCDFCVMIVPPSALCPPTASIVSDRIDLNGHLMAEAFSEFLSRRGPPTDLLHERQKIADTPVLGDFAILDTHNVNSLEMNLSVSRRDDETVRDGKRQSIFRSYMTLS